MARSVHPQSEINFGEPIKYDPDFHGPLRGRSCTDILCLFLFLIFIVCWVGIGIFAIKNGDSELLFVPKDSEGKRCGHDSDVADKPYLFFIDLTKCVDPKVIVTKCNTTQICMKKCPKDYWMYQKDGFDKSKVICKDQPRDEADFIRKADEGTCAKFYMPSASIFKRCIYWELPSTNGLTRNKDDGEMRTSRLLKDRISVGLSWLSLSVQNTIAHITDNKDAQKFVSLITEDLIQSWWKILLGFAGAMVVCLIYILLMRWIAGFMVYLSIFGVIALLIFGVVMTALQYKKLKIEAREVELEDLASLWEQKTFVLTLLIILLVILIVCLLVLLFLRKRIVIAIALIREGSKAVSAVTSSLFFPIIPWLFQIAIIAYAITVGLYLTSVGNPIYKVKSSGYCSDPNLQNGTICNPSDHIYNSYSIASRSSVCKDAICGLSYVEKPVIVKIFHAFNIVGLFWGVFFITALGEMILAATFATWYWTYRKTDVPFFTLTQSILRTFRYHIGTLAFGSLIITICRLIRIALEYVDHKLKKYDNAFVRGILCCCKCFFWCLETFMKFINKNAYIMCAIHGKNFCSSAKDAFNLLMRNVIRVFVVDKVTDMLLFLGKFLVTGIVAVIAFTAFTNADFNMVNTEDLHYVLVPVGAIAIGTYFITCVFFSVYSMAVDTLFLCFLEDCERNDGSAEKPYFMSKELMKILGKKNKLS